MNAKGSCRENMTPEDPAGKNGSTILDRQRIGFLVWSRHSAGNADPEFMGGPPEVCRMRRFHCFARC